MTTLAIESALLAAYLTHEEVLRRIAPLLGYQENFALTKSLLALRKAIGLPGMMSVSPARKPARYEESVPTNADCCDATSDVPVAEWMQDAHDSERKG